MCMREDTREQELDAEGLENGGAAPGVSPLPSWPAVAQSHPSPVWRALPPFRFFTAGLLACYRTTDVLDWRFASSVFHTTQLDTRCHCEIRESTCGRMLNHILHRVLEVRTLRYSASVWRLPSTEDCIAERSCALMACRFRSTSPRQPMNSRRSSRMSRPCFSVTHSVQALCGRQHCAQG